MGGMLLPIIYLYSLFLMKLHAFFLLLLFYFALNSSVLRFGFSFFFKKEFTLPVFSFKESIDFGTIRNNNTVEKQPESSPGWILLHFLVLLEIDGKNHAFPIW